MRIVVFGFGCPLTGTKCTVTLHSSSNPQQVLILRCSQSFMLPATA